MLVAPARLTWITGAVSAEARLRLSTENPVAEPATAAMATAATVADRIHAAELRRTRIGGKVFDGLIFMLLPILAQGTAALALHHLRRGASDRANLPAGRRTRLRRTYRSA